MSLSYLLSKGNDGVIGASRTVVRNPYAKSSQRKPQQLSSSHKEIRNRQKSHGSNMQTSGATTEQYPRRIVARRRAPRDFGLSLRIQDDTDSDDSKDDDLLSFVAFRK